MERTLFDDEHDLFRESFRRFVADEITPNLERWEADVRDAQQAGRPFTDLDGDLRAIYDALVAWVAEGGSHEGGAEVRAILTEFSSNRARQGYSPSDTAVAVFALAA